MHLSTPLFLLVPCFTDCLSTYAAPLRQDPRAAKALLVQSRYKVRRAATTRSAAGKGGQKARVNKPTKGSARAARTPKSTKATGSQAKGGSKGKASNNPKGKGSQIKAKESENFQLPKHGEEKQQGLSKAAAKVYMGKKDIQDKAKAATQKLVDAGNKHNMPQFGQMVRQNVKKNFPNARRSLDELD
ncbi:hypothetical protein C8J56DRAFT_1060646 [Mycena floridula]|nr:hypothetical protein C8J56DRAFT_1060646 [Mycena floridula]